MDKYNQHHWWFAPLLTAVLILFSGCVSWLGDSNNVGDPVPVIASGTVDNASPMEGEAITLTVSATDPQGQTLTYTWDDGNPSAGVFSGSGATVSWSSDTPGTYNITCTVTDPDGNVAVRSFVVEVVGDTTATWSLTGINASNTTPKPGDDVTLTAAVTNPDGTALTYAWSDGGGGTFNGSGASVTWSSTTEGNYTLSVSVSDGTNSDSLSVNVTVSETVIPNDAPVFVDDEGNPYELHGDVSAPVATQRIRFHGIKATDPDGDALTYEWTASGEGEFTDVTVDGDGFIEAYWAADAPGNYVVTVTADDGKGGVASVSAVTSLATDGFDVTDLPTEFDYVGYDGCNLCHSEIVDQWLTTNHSHALETTINPNPHGFRNESCYDCHAVGQFPVGEGGFIDQELTPQFANIQCESCHGGGKPAGMGSGHKPLPWDPGTGYEKDLDGNYVVVDGVYQYDEAYDGSNGYGCGLCHEGSRHGAYEEFMISNHANAPLFDEEGEPEHNLTGTSCIQCHNGGYFVDIQINGNDPPAESLTAENFNVMGSALISCATCHDPHNGPYDAQLRVDSNATVTIPWDDTEVGPAGTGMICMKCHNGRYGRSTYDSSIASGSNRFGPHGNPQAPVFWGLMGADLGAPADYDTGHAHASMTSNSCADCHMYSKPFTSADDPAQFGHELVAQVEACAVCHIGETDLETLISPLQTEIQGLLDDFVAAWPADWKDVSDPTNPSLTNRDTDPATGVGPARDDPTGSAYREALWNYKLVLSDKSMGVHNPAFVRDLLEQAIARVEELNAL